MWQGVGLILTVHSSPTLAQGNHLLWYAHGALISLDQQRPRTFKSSTLAQGAKRQNGLPAGVTPAHARTLQALAHQGFTGSFYHARSNRQILRSQVRIAHPMAMLTKIRQRLMHRLTTGIARAQTLQRPDHFVHSLRVIAKHGAQRLYH